MKYKRVMDLSSRKTVFFKNMLSSIRKPFRTKEKPPDDIFTLPSHALPSQYRTLLPVKDVEIERLLTLERRRRLIRNATLAISSIIVIFIIVVIALIIIIQFSLDVEDRGPLRLTAVYVNRTQFQVDEIKLLKTKAMVKTPYTPLDTPNYRNPSYGVQCIAKCWEYAAFRFKAECVNGYCLCRDKHYDSYTCLPKTNDCSIKRHKTHPSFQAIRSGRVQTSYSCAPKKDMQSNTPKKLPRPSPDPSPEIHVISIYGDKDIKFTSLHFKSSKQINVTLILVSYEPVTWDVALDANVHTENIVLISHYGVSRTQVRIASHTNKSTGEPNHYTSTSSSQSASPLPLKSKTPSETPPTTIPPNQLPGHITPPNRISDQIQVNRLLIRTGYGDDRASGNTPFLLDQITKRIGPISSFFGVANADNIVFDIGLGNYELNSMKKMDSDFYEKTYKT